MTSIDSIATRLMSNYDRDGSGAIELSNSAELERLEQRNNGGSWYTAKISAARTFKAADQAGNGDGIVTKDEVVALASRYDTGAAFWLPNTKGDGQLDGVEILRAMGEVGEQLQGIIGASGREDGGGSFLAAGDQGGVFVTAGPKGGFVLGGSKSGNWFTALGDALKGAWASRMNGQSNSGQWGNS